MHTLPDKLPQDAGAATDHHHGGAGPADTADVQTAILYELRALNARIDVVANAAVAGLAAADQFRPALESILAALAGHPLLSRLIRL